jgi:hypothetical protein
MSKALASKVRFLVHSLAAQLGQPEEHMRMATLTAGAVFLVVVSARGAEITTDQKQIIVSSDRKHVIVQGTWRRVSERATVEVPRVNSVRIECDRTAGFCNEYIAKFIQETDDPTGAMKRPYLFLMKERFRVIEWTETTITARAEPRAADIDLRISFADRSAERTSRETESRGAKGANLQNIAQWVLL